MPMDSGISLIPLTGIGEIEPGADLALMVAEVLAPRHTGGPTLQSGDVVVVTQKVVSKAEGQIVPIDLDDPTAKSTLIEKE
jgi:coenzyme F420-0:L-glutamate ligase/coenzyme F420-1:gamma-L-glutamate ligase